MPTPTSSSAPTRRCASSRPISGAPSATSADRSPAKTILQAIFLGRCTWPPGCSSRTAISAGRKVYSLHAPEVECIGKGKAHGPTSSGSRSSVATTLHRSKGGQFALHAKALPGNPYDGHTLATVIPEMEAHDRHRDRARSRRCRIQGPQRALSHKFRVYTAGQKRRMTPAIKREMRRRAAIEPVIGHIKNEHRMGRNYLAHQQGDAINAILAAAGYNFRLLLNWLRLFCARS